MADPLPQNDGTKTASPGRGGGASLLDAAAAEGLRFFGRTSASISHELKNTLSIMNESAGLIEDLALLAEKGRPLDPARVRTLGATIKRQIQRTDQIIRNMNRFSHNVDDPFKQIELVDFLEFVLAVSRRLTAAKGVTVTVHPRDQPLMIVTRPFFLHSLLWRLLEYGMERVGKSKALSLTPEEREPGIWVRLTGLETPAPPAGQGFPAPPEKTLLDLLEAQLKVDPDEKALILVLPTRVGEEVQGKSASKTSTEGATS
jgi:hypothetical protein